MPAAGGQLGCDDCGKLTCVALQHLGIVFAQAIDQELQAGCGRERAATGVVMWQGRVFDRRIRKVFPRMLDGGANAVKDHFAGLDNGAHFVPPISSTPFD